ncbi:MAG TPA: MFS transporter [Candidatus Binataceae bacterium]|nr:MFS transporter [Candidatus Binataceae bacterium]
MARATHDDRDFSGASHARSSGGEIFSTLIPARLDRLPWSRFHWLLVIGLGITWVLDGLEVTLMGAISAVLQRPDVLHFSAAEIGSISSAYLAGAVIGSLVFGHLTDRFGRRMFFFVSLSIYLIGVGLTAVSWNLISFGLFRFITGMGIGGEYSAVNSAIDELIPARLRGRIDLIINGSYWLGAALGAASTLVILDPHLLPVTIGWRVGFGAGAIIGLVVLFLREFIPESPRWLMTHGRRDDAEKTVHEIEETVEHETGAQLKQLDQSDAIRIKVRHDFGLGVILKPMVTKYRSRTLLGLTLMIAQAFVYNAIFFTYALVLNRYLGVKADAAGLYLLPFAFSNFLGPLLLGHFFDSIGRRQMIAATFAIAGGLLIVTGYLFAHGALTSFSLTILWTVMFFFASPAASSAYLTVSEIFPLEMRALAIALFYSVGTAVGGIVAPWYFGRLIDTGSRGALMEGYLVAAALMIGAAIVEVFLGVAAEGASLEKIAEPLSSAS